MIRRGRYPSSKSAPSNELDTVPKLDLRRFQGEWFEISHYNVAPLNPGRFFERGCVCTRADYTLRQDGTLLVRNECRKNNIDGKLIKAELSGRVPNPATPGKLVLSAFAGLVRAPFQVISCDTSSYALIGEPKRNQLYVLSRRPDMEEGTYRRLLAEAKRQGFKTELLAKTKQANCWGRCLSTDQSGGRR
eukprot:tig00001284_g8000.t1